MFKIEIFDGVNWTDGSLHTLEVDAQNQLTRFQDSGIAPENLRLTQI